MDRRQVIKLGAVIGGAAVAGGIGFALWARQGASAWAEAVEAIRRPLTVATPDGLEGHRELVRYATLAANSHNTQPWRFEIGAGAIVITPDATRRCAVVDPDDHHLFASLGCAAENIVQAAPLLGLRAVPDFDPADGGRVVVALEPGAVETSALADAIPQRQCTRSVYDGRAAPPRQVRELEQAGRGAGVDVLMVTDRSGIEEMLGFIIDGNSQQVDDPAFVAELKHWLRFSYGGALATGDGLFAPVSGNPVLPGPTGDLLFGLVFSAAAENRKIAEQMRSSAGVAVFSSEVDDPAHWVEAGRAYQRFALTATALGFRHAFLNQPVEVAAVRQRFADYFGLSGRRPDLVVRFGYGEAMPRSLRRPVEDVLV